jgi:hypothetical protein
MADDFDILEDADGWLDDPARDERRATPRVALRLGVRFSSPDELAEAVRATTNNIGLGGLCLRTQRAYAPGSRLDLAIEIGGGRTLNVGAVVAWSRSGRAVGVRFDGLDEMQKAELAGLLQRPLEASEDLDPEGLLGP